MNLSKLSEPFDPKDIEWRIGQAGTGARGVWATCLAYIQSRAIMDRLDEVCGPGNWKVEYRFERAGEGVIPGVIARLGIRVGDEWVFKEDGAEQTDIEAFKGGLSSALKRAGSAWGIGRYLYDLEAGYAEVSEDKKPGWNYGKTKDGKAFYWQPPKLPAWALPSKSAAQGPAPEPKQTVAPPKAEKPASRKEIGALILKTATAKGVTPPELEKLSSEMFGSELKSLSVDQMEQLYKEIA